MADSKISETKSETKNVISKQAESIYTIDELSTNAKHLFGVQAECVIAALKVADIKECTVSKAKEVVENFMRREVK